ncbi:MAG: ankyrin repeat domain-containing protein [Puniceicoccales bacterium]|jgi:hypothetical protein|nr:ankyrin repeat domain-containing protein [Puniceicoccales bacterium]
MVINKYKIIGNVFLTFGFLCNGICSVQEDELRVQEKSSLEEDLWYRVEYAENTREDLTEIAKLIRSGADVTCKDEEGKTLLYEACHSGILALLLCLLDIDIDSQDNEGNTALHYFVLCHLECFDGSGFEDEIKLLLSCGANPCLRNSKGKTARQLLEDWKREEEELPKEERSRNFEEEQERCAEMIQRLREAEEEWTATHGE